MTLPILPPLLLALLLSGCGMLPGTSTDATPAVEGDRDPATAQASDRPADWRPTKDLVQPLPGAEQAETSPAFTADDPAQLNREVRLRCQEMPPGMSRRDSLRLLVTELYAARVPAADATEALIRGDCSGLGAIVREMVEQGGDGVVAPVVDRTLFLMGPGVEGIVEAAATTGLERDMDPVGATRTTSRPSALYYAMAYFPVDGEAAQVQQSASLSQLFGASDPGFGVYTYILFGAGFDDGAAPNLATYRELLRVIETYVLATDGAGAIDRGQAHSFLVPVHPERAGESLLDQTGPELSSHGRKAYAVYLEGRGQRELARRLLTRPGPFLVSSLEPRLIPSDAWAPRLVVDLSAVGPEYMYSVVDAYDRTIPAEQVGSPESLAPIRSRLMALFPDPIFNSDSAPPDAGDWVFLLGRRQVARTDEPAAPPTPQPTDGG